MRETTLLPKARTEGLIINDSTDELLVYDLKRDQAHCLNPTAAAIWKLCDGQSTAAQIARRLGNQRSEVGDQTLTEQLVWLGLEQLGRDHLLEERMRWPAAIPRMSRREAMRLGLGAAIAVPIIASISAPLPAQAGTCKARNANCSTGSECCSKACVGTKCA